MNYSKERWVSSSHATQHPEGWEMLSTTVDLKALSGQESPNALEYSVIFKEMCSIASLTGAKTVCNTAGCEGFIKGPQFQNLCAVLWERDLPMKGKKTWLVKTLLGLEKATGGQGGPTLSLVALQQGSRFCLFRHQK